MRDSKDLLGVEMEAFALYANAIRNKKNALCILTVSDSFVSKKSMSAEERQTSLKDMVVLGLETAIRI
jgi:purine-nucleoside phosphorylase